MKNGDMPAMPTELTVKLYPPRGSGYPSSKQVKCSGLTKREEFAARAMQALIPIYWDDVKDGTSNYRTAEEVLECMMESACDHADALLKELEK